MVVRGDGFGDDVVNVDGITIGIHKYPEELADDHLVTACPINIISHGVHVLSHLFPIAAS